MKMNDRAYAFFTLIIFVPLFLMASLFIVPIGTLIHGRSYFDEIVMHFKEFILAGWDLLIHGDN